MTDRSLHMTARGRVQGVGFRFFVREQAARYGVNGWVRNRADNSVEIRAEGDRDTLLEFMERIREGPHFGRVSDLEVEWGDPSRDFTSFTIEF